MKILLTGGTGFIGRALVLRLLNAGHDLALLVRKESNIDQFIFQKEKMIFVDFDDDVLSLSNRLAELQPEIVIHLSSLFLSEHEITDVEKLVRSNVDLPTKLLEAMSHSGVKSFLNTGTSWQHFEDNGYSPVNLYSATKQAFEDILTFYVEAKSFKAITLKLFDTYGPNDNRKKLFYLLRQAAKGGLKIDMSPGEQVLDLLFIDDVVNAYLVGIDTLIHSPAGSNKKYAVTNNERIRLKDLVSKYEKVTGQNLIINWGQRPYRLREVMLPARDLEVLPGWFPMIGLEEGIKRMEQAQ